MNEIREPDLTEQIQRRRKRSSGELRAGESKDCNWDGLRCDGLRRDAAARAGECSDFLCSFNEHNRLDDDRDWIDHRINHRECDRFRRWDKRWDKRWEWFSLIAVDDHDCQSVHFVYAVADQSKLSAESLLRQRDDGHRHAGDPAALAR